MSESLVNISLQQKQVERRQAPVVVTGVLVGVQRGDPGICTGPSHAAIQVMLAVHSSWVSPSSTPRPPSTSVIGDACAAPSSACIAAAGAYVFDIFMILAP